VWGGVGSVERTGWVLGELCGLRWGGGKVRICGLGLSPRGFILVPISTVLGISKLVNWVLVGWCIGVFECSVYGFQNR